MSQFQRARILGLLAMAGCLVILAACGTTITRRELNPPPPGGYNQPQYVTAYQNAIGGFLTASNQNKVQALMFHVLTQGDPNFNDFKANILPNVSGVTIGLPWSQIETSQGVYDGWASFDANLAPYIQAGKEVNLVVWPATEGGNNDPNNGGSTPSYVFSQGYATSLSTTPLDMTVCSSYTGDTGNPFYSQAVAGNGGSWNITTNGDLSGLPVSYEKPFMTAYQAFITQVIQHYNGNTATPIGYIRFGFSQGGENSPECNQYWPGYSHDVYLSYIQTMTQFVHSQSPSMVILQDLHAVGPPGSVDYTYADEEAADVVSYGNFGLDTNGLQQGDAANFAANLPCDSDWCALFNTYPSKPIKSLQTLQWSDPTGQLQTGSLSVIIPFAQAHDANNLELYLADLALAYSPNGGYCNYQHAVC